MLPPPRGFAPYMGTRRRILLRCCCFQARAVSLACLFIGPGRLTSGSLRRRQGRGGCRTDFRLVTRSVTLNVENVKRYALTKSECPPSLRPADLIISIGATWVRERSPRPSQTPGRLPLSRRGSGTSSSKTPAPTRG